MLFGGSIASHMKAWSRCDCTTCEREASGEVVSGDPAASAWASQLTYVADDAFLVEESAAPARAEVLLECDLHRLDVLAAPRGLEELIAPAQRGDVEHDLPKVYGGMGAGGEWWRVMEGDGS